jgi:hypothetical protein
VHNGVSFVPELGPLCFRNSTEDPVNGLHMIFNGAGGTLSRGAITVGPPGRITITDNQITFHLNGSLPPGMPLCVKIWSESEPISVETVFWSWNDAVVGRAEVIPAK